MKQLFGFIVLFIIAAIVLSLVQYFQKPTSIVVPNNPTPLVSSSTQTISKNPLLTPTQEAALEKIGIDPTTLPTKITPQMEACFIAKLGLARVAEIKAGSMPTTAEAISARSCF